jgi:hypothetical protein
MPLHGNIRVVIWPRAGSGARCAVALACLVLGGLAASCRCGDRRPPPRPSGPLPPGDASVTELRPPSEIDRPDAGLRLPVVPEREPNNWPEYAQKITPGVAIRGTIGFPLTKTMGDRDVYCFKVGGTDKQVLRAELTAVPRLQLQLTVRTARFVTVKTTRSPGVGRELIIANLSLEPGDYCFVVSEARGGPPHRFNRKQSYLLHYSLRAARAAEEREPNDKFYEANELRPGGEIRGLLGRAGDKDWYRIPLVGLPKGSLLGLTFEGVGGVTADVTVYDWARRKILTRRSVRGATLYIRDLKVRLLTRIVYVTVTAHHRFNPDDSYRLRVQATRAEVGREVEPNDTAQQAVRLTGKRGEVRGSIEVAHDVDYYHLALPGRSNVRVSLAPPAAVDAKLTVYALSGRRLAEANFGKAGETELLANVRASHGIRLRVAAVARTFDPRHSYRLRWVVTPADRGDEREPNDKLRQANVVVPGVSARGYIYPNGDVDFYRFRLPGVLGTTQRVRISVQGVPRVRLQLTLLDDQQNVLATNALPTTEGLRQITTTLHCSKLYYVRIRDPQGRHANATDNYELILARTRR